MVRVLNFGVSGLDSWACKVQGLRNPGVPDLKPENHEGV